MVEIRTNQVTTEIRDLFRKDEPQAPRCFRILDGALSSGRIFTDDLVNPAWAVVQEPFDNSLYFGGRTEVGIIQALIRDLRRAGDVLVGMWMDDPRIDLLPGDNYYDGRVLEFYSRPIGEGLTKILDSLPGGYELHRMDRELIMKSERGPDDVRMAGGVEAWEAAYRGYCLLHENEIAAEATAGPPALGMHEPGVFTEEAHRNKGCGTIVSAKLIQEIESQGGQTYWNCAKQNTASAAIARKLGYRVMVEYRCIAWKKAS